MIKQYNKRNVVTRKFYNYSSEDYVRLQYLVLNNFFQIIFETSYINL